MLSIVIAKEYFIQSIKKNTKLSGSVFVLELNFDRRSSHFLKYLTSKFFSLISLYSCDFYRRYSIC